LENEVRGLLTRVNQVKPFVLTMPMVRAANIPDAAQRGVSQLIAEGTEELRRKAGQFIQKIKTNAGDSPESLQKDFVLLKLRFNALLDKFDIFADVLNQRAEHHTGVWLAGLDTVAKDALSVVRGWAEMPPLITYLDRGHGAAIRRARTRLPGGKKNPVAIIRVPRERMVSSGIASSLIHEVGHQGAALLGLHKSLGEAIRQRETQSPLEAEAWKLYGRWISEILSDCWAVGMLGVGATTGLMGVVSLPRYFVFRMNLDDPHPFPWIRVMLSIGFGRMLYPDPQWDRLEKLWIAAYPLESLPQKQQDTIHLLRKTIPAFVALVFGHQPDSLKGKTFRSIFPEGRRTPQRLRSLYEQWKEKPEVAQQSRPTLVFAVLGQARADNRISPEKEAEMLTGLLKKWAMNRNV
jgi:hypothetical protein